jgi:hypothetical protein
MTDLDQSTPGFQHRYSPNGRVESVCLRCCPTVSTAFTFRDLKRAEIEHQCQQPDRSRFGASLSRNATWEEL